MSIPRFSDTLKAEALSLALFLASVTVFYEVSRRQPDHAWWILASAVFGFAAFFSILFPVWILPLFFKCAPLRDPSLTSLLEDASRRCGLGRLPLYEIRLGEKTVRANAMLAGFGKTRRILVGDTLLSGYSPEEIRMVLLHEIGHHACAHLWKSLILEAILAGAGLFWLLQFSSRLVSFFQAQDFLDLRLFPALMLISFLASLLAMPIRNGFSRAHEREADRYALKKDSDIATFRSLMEKLSRQNLANPAPSKWEEFWLYTHPSRRNRIEHAEKFLRTQPA